jgi:hypothetical protein
METIKGGRKSHTDELEETRELMNSISPSFCLAKWMQHTLYLQNGMNHSCHHPPTHKIPVEEIKNNPKALHNTQHKKKRMQQMLDGKKPSECDYCWRVEEKGNNFFSDRIYKSQTSWAMPNIYDILEKGSETDIEPSYLEISFSNVCNLKCAYCSPDLSSKWMEEIKEHGHYPTHYKHNNLTAQRDSGRMPIPNKDDNPYVDAFWKWWPDLYPSLHTLRLTGGEPLMSKDCWKVLEAIRDNPRDDLVLAINTNLDVEPKLLERFIAIAKEIGPKIREFQIFTSGESSGAAAEYARYGLNYDRWYSNCDYVLSELYGKFNMVFAFMTTVNILSVGSYDDFIKDILKLRAKYIQHRDDGNLLPCMTNFLRYPNFLAACNLDHDTIAKVEQKLQLLVDNYRVGIHTEDTGFLWEDEINQIERLVSFMKDDNIGDLDMNRSDFWKFIDEYDTRRQLNFNETFPELHNYYNLSKTYDYQG